ncbi:MAG: DoxX family protein [Gammaproteobacteria bacterium]|uniref:DoxX family protein n=1 Tax=SAR86 cluster bacterium TaxID=2030880 RepID=A0A520MZJ7_9GAMM|nr:DoxX family protein [Gammaproteobacteria bacterium]MBA4730373.1 DoxX family protein [SAR86 cluster bacterium]RPG35054.1 MAG: DoxX family protein [Gammaproteobacteria bacterium TMED193]RZO26641.1 MAG: DoxX family protein [SAR86 cluster bacterium]
MPSEAFYKLGRVLLGIYFLLPGISKFLLFESNFDLVVERQVPFPTFSLFLIGVLQIIFGLLLILGRKVSLSSLVLVIVTLLINFYIHDFWNMSGEESQQHETQNFIKNLGIIAGLLLLTKDEN